ncbi:DUF4143 domain-containing protein [Metamycoplasma salivarium]|uniref:DUF4143 domain-containing protein n=1 Tax=Metamycoplasma salivarium TaxID=2124 RepID=UPI001F457915|nr:hypothetical protein [Metamycoplasma salivarium]GIZ06172.1 hypothetical protein MSATCC23557_1440 [Metamycoplasma salivarium]
MYPLSFHEFYSAYNGDVEQAFQAYIKYGGLPQLLNSKGETFKEQYIKNVLSNTYLSDIKNRYNVRNLIELNNLLAFVANNIGSIVSPSKISNTIKTFSNNKIFHQTINKYLEYFEDAFLIEKVIRSNLKGKKIFNTFFICK